MFHFTSNRDFQGLASRNKRYLLDVSFFLNTYIRKYNGNNIGINKVWYNCLFKK